MNGLIGKSVPNTGRIWGEHASGNIFRKNGINRFVLLYTSYTAKTVLKQLTRGTFLAMQVTTPPTESPLTLTASIAAIIFTATSGSGQRQILASICRKQRLISVIKPWNQGHMQSARDFSAKFLTRRRSPTCSIVSLSWSMSPSGSSTPCTRET